jgi:hypothetical protein
VSAFAFFCSICSCQRMAQLYSRDPLLLFMGHWPRKRKAKAFFSLALEPNSDLGPLIVEVSRSHTTRHTRTRQDSCERVISFSHRPLPAQHTVSIRDEHPCPPRDSNSRSPQSSGRRPTPQTARPLGSTKTRKGVLN